MEKGRVILFMGMKGGEISVDNEIEKFVSSEWEKKKINLRVKISTFIFHLIGKCLLRFESNFTSLTVV